MSAAQWQPGGAEAADQEWDSRIQDSREKESSRLCRAQGWEYQPSEAGVSTQAEPGGVWG